MTRAVVVFSVVVHLPQWGEQNKQRMDILHLKKVEIFGYIFQDTPTAFLHQYDNISGLKFSYQPNDDSKLTGKNLRHTLPK